MINLKDWTAYYSPRQTQALAGDVTLLMETARPADVGQFLQHELEIPAANRVHVGLAIYHVTENI